MSPIGKLIVPVDHSTIPSSPTNITSTIHRDGAGDVQARVRQGGIASQIQEGSQEGRAGHPSQEGRSCKVAQTTQGEIGIGAQCRQQRLLYYSQPLRLPGLIAENHPISVTSLTPPIPQELSAKINNSVEQQMVSAASGGKLTIMKTVVPPTQPSK